MSNWQIVPGLQIAIDGPSGSGKGTVAARLAAELGLPVLDTGLLYRFTGYMANRRGVDCTHEAAVLKVLAEIEAQMEWRQEGIFLAGEDLTPQLRSEGVGRFASQVAALPGVRRALLELQRAIAGKGCVMDGRDIGTVVLPDAPAKFFLTASVRERARRRWAQLQGGGGEVSFEQVVSDIRERDQRDSERSHAPLEMATDAIRIDSTTLRIDEVLERMAIILQRRGLINAIAAAPNQPN